MASDNQVDLEQENSEHIGPPYTAQELFCSEISPVGAICSLGVGIYALTGWGQCTLLPYLKWMLLISVTCTVVSGFLKCFFRPSQTHCQPVFAADTCLTLCVMFPNAIAIAIYATPHVADGFAGKDCPSHLYQAAFFMAWIPIVIIVCICVVMVPMAIIKGINEKEDEEEEDGEAEE